ncbi:unnamed protein product [Cyclocybe aegerita]|uniref:Uncharacterized protein n=1 Tax=Cyclocybe aegerita TaxID=1973307 RepID=A0A8S0WHU1_CYCAE|nr:unnamed protein product [Cyclocybe aegerita]
MALSSLSHPLPTYLFAVLPIPLLSAIFCRSRRPHTQMYISVHAPTTRSITEGSHCRLMAWRVGTFGVVVGVIDCVEEMSLALIVLPASRTFPLRASSGCATVKLREYPTDDGYCDVVGAALPAQFDIDDGIDQADYPPRVHSALNVASATRWCASSILDLELEKTPHVASANLIYPLPRGSFRCRRAVVSNPSKSYAFIHYPGSILEITKTHSRFKNSLFHLLQPVSESHRFPVSSSTPFPCNMPRTLIPAVEVALTPTGPSHSKFATAGDRWAQSAATIHRGVFRREPRLGVNYLLVLETTKC